mmetsp:Transcript_16150/g.45767  ORF Transcript_16150/g.45767 Transcript_16150/m.45767 type:complete len:86 (+) Transcript_16150:643-900(+)
MRAWKKSTQAFYQDNCTSAVHLKYLCLKDRVVCILFTQFLPCFCIHDFLDGDCDLSVITRIRHDLELVLLTHIDKARYCFPIPQR